VHFDLEIKQPGIEDEVLAVLDRFPGTRWAISSFQWEILQAVRSLTASAELWVLTMTLSDDVFAIAKELRATAVSLFAPALTPAAAVRLASAGLRTVVWTVNDPAVAFEMQRRGAFGLCTDVPGEMLTALARAPEST
jgi:glycerophosphoryl diester phosphodiesterase